MNAHGASAVQFAHRASFLWMLFVIFFIVFDFAFIEASPISSNGRGRSLHNPVSLDGRQYNAVFPVLGVAGLEDQDCSAHPRLEIRELTKRKTQWNLFVLGLQRFQNSSQSDTLSYFQIAGIHGRPWSAWDGVAGDPSSLQHGYCQHSSALFPSWHRPYLALFEEILYLNARQVISEFPKGVLRDDYQASLHELRLPYWDWAAIPPVGESVLPMVLQKPTLSVDLPNGPAEIANPLYAFKFRSIPDWEVEDDDRWKIWTRTMRHPTTLDASAESQNSIVASMLDGNRAGMQTRVFGLLALQHEYLPMSNKLQTGDSLESIHGTIHDMVGGDGHMLWLQYSAFDPVFWLHHANVDRLIAIWQSLNEEKWLSTDSVNQEPSFAIPRGTEVNAQTPLKPFRKSDAGDFWTSSQVRDWRVFGYTYRDVQNLSANDTLVSRVNDLYGPNAIPRSYDDVGTNSTYNPIIPSTPPAQEPPLYNGSALSTSPNVKSNSEFTRMQEIRENKGNHRRRVSAALTDALSFTHRRQYTIDISLYASSIKGSLKFYFFLTDPPLSERVDSWVDEMGFVGFSSILATTSTSVSNHDDGHDGSSGSGGYTRKNKANTIVPLTAALEGEVRKGELRSLEEGDVDEFLRRRLRWVVVVANNNAISHEAEEQLSGLQISVSWQEMEPARSPMEFPRPMGDVHILRVVSQQDLLAGQLS